MAVSRMKRCFLTKIARVLLFIFALSFLFPSRVLADSVVVKAIEDTYANQAYPDKVNGSSSAIIMSNHPTLRFAYFKFPYPDLPGGSSIEKIRLRLYVYEQHYSPDVKVAFGVTTSAWSEATLTFNSTPSRWANEISIREVTISIGAVDLDVTNLFDYVVFDKTILNRWKDGDDTGFVLIPYSMVDNEAIVNDFAFTFRSSESTAGIPPELIIDYTPPPTPTNTPTSTPTPTVSPEPTTTGTTGEGTGLGTPTLSGPEVEDEESATTSPEKEKSTTTFSLPQVLIIIIGLFVVGITSATVAWFYLKKRKKDEDKKKQVDDSEKDKPKEKVEKPDDKDVKKEAVKGKTVVKKEKEPPAK